MKMKALNRISKYSNRKMVDSAQEAENPKDPNDPVKTYGFEFYPERRKEGTGYSFWQLVGFKNKFDTHCKVECEQNVFESFKTHPMVRLLLGALREAGCPVNMRRHVVCEECDSRVTGGYDIEFNQIVVCQNSFKARKNVAVTLIHELIHMYDYCVGEANFKNLEHLACTEIRAANIAHCSFMSSLLLGESSPINIKKTHQYCVQLKAAQSMMASRGIDFPTAMDIILKVFDKCYNDLEPIGRRIKRNSLDSQMAYSEGKVFEYCDP